MPPRVTKSRAAERDLLNHFVFIGRRSVKAARGFLRAAERAMERLARMPELGGLWESDDPALAGLRCWPLRKYENFVIFYRAVPGGVEVVRVLRGAQDVEAHLGG